MTAPSEEFRCEFADREDLIAYLKAQFPEAAARDDRVSPIRGGRRAADAAMKRLDPTDYAASRNYLSGTVTRLSPYLRYGVVGMAELRDAILHRAGRKGVATKLLNELGWRDYFQRRYAQIGNGVWQDQGRLGTGYAPDEYGEELPEDIATGTTGLACIDAFSVQLRTIGYLHNHARLWLAAYLVHWRRVRWQTGARWFLGHLLDGDPASNNLNWQWVAGALGHRPYVFTRENLEQYIEGAYCAGCPLYGRCPFEGSHADHAARLFRPEPGLPTGGAR